MLESKIMIEDYTFKCSNRTSQSHFTRCGKVQNKVPRLIQVY